MATMESSNTTGAGSGNLPNGVNLSDYIDLEDGLARVRGNKKIYKMLLGSYVKNTYLDQLKGEVASGDADAASKTAHTIKGVAANLSLKALYDLIVELEAQLKDGQNVEAGMQKLEEVVGNTLSCIEIASATL